ncbi:uncharacterized protein [Euwallacea similis]|uniref:uncharacterized protein isoform X2 n=1 Tax=Euwallacea similis TaxID=1736056 RepID=UPI00344C45FF
MDPPLKCIAAVVTSTLICLNLSVAFVPRNNVDGDMMNNVMLETNGSSQNKDRYSPVWFAPRMGKQIGNGELNDRPIKFSIVDSLDEYPWAMVTSNGNKEKRNKGKNFIPRLGRTLHDDENDADDDSDIRTDESIEVERGRPFSYYRRPGRGGHTIYSPRLGRDEDNYV